MIRDGICPDSQLFRWLQSQRVSGPTPYSTCILFGAITHVITERPTLSKRLQFENSTWLMESGDGEKHIYFCLVVSFPAGLDKKIAKMTLTQYLGLLAGLLLIEFGGTYPKLLSNMTLF